LTKNPNVVPFLWIDDSIQTLSFTGQGPEYEGVSCLGVETERQIFVFFDPGQNKDIANVFPISKEQKRQNPRVTHNVFLSIVSRSLNKKRPDSPQWGGINAIRGTRIPKSPRQCTTITMPNPAANATIKPIPKKALYGIC
jgi:hypothetical protein